MALFLSNRASSNALLFLPYLSLPHITPSIQIRNEGVSCLHVGPVGRKGGLCF